MFRLACQLFQLPSSLCAQRLPLCSHVCVMSPQFFESLHGDANPIVSDDPSHTIDYNTWRTTDYMYDESSHPTAWTGASTVDYINSFDFDGEQPLFLKASFHRPHSPYDPPKRLHDKYKELIDEMPARYVTSDGYDQGYKNRTDMLDDAWRGDPGDAEARKTRAGYYASIEFVDENVGRILDALDEKGVLDEMWVVWTSDHGDMQVRRAKRSEQRGGGRRRGTNNRRGNAPPRATGCQRDTSDSNALRAAQNALRARPSRTI